MLGIKEVFAISNQLSMFVFSLLLFKYCIIIQMSVHLNNGPLFVDISNFHL